MAKWVYSPSCCKNLDLKLHKLGTINFLGGHTSLTIGSYLHAKIELEV